MLKESLINNVSKWTSSHPVLPWCIKIEKLKKVCKNWKVYSSVLWYSYLCSWCCHRSELKSIWYQVRVAVRTGRQPAQIVASIDAGVEPGRPVGLTGRPELWQGDPTSHIQHQHHILAQHYNHPPPNPANNYNGKERIFSGGLREL